CHAGRTRRTWHAAPSRRGILTGAVAMAIWKQRVDLDTVNAWSARTLMRALDIRITEIGDDFLRGTMPVDDRTRQPYGILHGGASVALAETLGSTAAMLCCEDGRAAVGL